MPQVPSWLLFATPNLSGLWAFAKPNAMLLATTMALGALVERSITASSSSESRFPRAIASNIQLVTALTSLEDVLPNPLMMGPVVRLCESLCRLEFQPYMGARYLAIEMVRQIEAELIKFRVIPWLTEDLIDIEVAVMDAVRVVQTNISVNF